MIRVLIVDDHALFREGLARLLAAEPDFEVRRCGTILLAEAMLAEGDADIILLDFDLGEESPAAFLEVRRRLGYPGKVLIVTAGLNRLEAEEMRALGVNGIVLKNESPQRLSQIVRDIVNERPEAGADTDFPREESSASRVFTARDREVARAVLEGLSNKEIATRLAISESAVKASLQLLFAKTGVRSRSQLVRVAIEEYRGQL